MSKRALVLGGAGQLGRSVVSRFMKSGWKTISVDHVYSEEATGSIEIPQGKFFIFSFFDDVSTLNDVTTNASRSGRKGLD